MAALGLSTPSHWQVPRWGWKQREKCLVHGKLPACNPCLATPTVSGVQMSATAKGQDGCWVIWSSLVTQVPYSWDLCLRGASLGRTLPCQQGFLNIDCGSVLPYLAARITHCPPKPSGAFHLVTVVALPSVSLPVPCHQPTLPGGFLVILYGFLLIRMSYVKVFLNSMPCPSFHPQASGCGCMLPQNCL